MREPSVARRFEKRLLTVETLNARSGRSHRGRTGRKLARGWYDRIQIATVNGQRFSDAEFKPLREQSLTPSGRKLVVNILADNPTLTRL